MVHALAVQLAVWMGCFLAQQRWPTRDSVQAGYGVLAHTTRACCLAHYGICPPILGKCSVALAAPRALQWIDELACLVCGAGDNDEQLMLCEGAENLRANRWKCGVA